jgi:hypothetical protein
MSEKPPDQAPTPLSAKQLAYVKKFIFNKDGTPKSPEEMDRAHFEDILEQAKSIGREIVFPSLEAKEEEFEKWRSNRQRFRK